MSTGAGAALHGPLFLGSQDLITDLIKIVAKVDPKVQLDSMSRALSSKLM